MACACVIYGKRGKPEGDLLWFVPTFSKGYQTDSQVGENAGITQTCPPTFSLSKGIFEIWLRGGVGISESRHHRGKYLRCPDLRPRGWNKSRCPGKANRIFHQNAVPHQTFIRPFFMVYYFLHKRHLGRRFLLSRFVPVLPHKSIWCIKCRRALPTCYTPTETCRVDALDRAGLHASSTRLCAQEVWITRSGRRWCK